jgi:hypothetical protein
MRLSEKLMYRHSKNVNFIKSAFHQCKGRKLYTEICYCCTKFLPYDQQSTPEPSLDMQRLYHKTEQRRHKGNVVLPPPPQPKYHGMEMYACVTCILNPGMTWVSNKAMQLWNKFPCANPVFEIWIQEECVQVYQQQARDSLTRLSFPLRNIGFIWECSMKNKSSRGLLRVSNERTNTR